MGDRRAAGKREQHLVAILWAVIVCTGYDLSGLHLAPIRAAQAAEACTR